MTFESALAAIDAAHAEDPRDSVDGPYELYYARKCTSYLTKIDGDASELLRLAVRAQHFRRWEVQRDAYPMTKAGYFAWRTGLKKRQAEQVSHLLLSHGYSAEEADRVASIIRKDNFKKDAETQTLEDVACLVFLDAEFEKFKETVEEDKIIHILQKTWPKMSERGHAVALQMHMSEECARLVQKALS